MAALALLAIVLGWSAFARAQAGAPDEAAQAQSAFDKGMGHYRLGEYDLAIEQWEAGFRIKPAPEFLYNIAQAHRLAKRAERALLFYRHFLSAAPDAPKRAEVERRIAALEKEVREHPTAASADTPTVTATPTPVPTPTPTEAPTPVVAAPSDGTPVVVADAPVKKPLYKKGWFWGATIGGVVVVAGAVTLGVIFGTRDTTPTLTSVRF